jgi:phosphate transport system protein
VTTPREELVQLDRRVQQLISLVGEALSGATAALLGGEPATGQTIVEADQAIDDATAGLDQLIWERLDAGSHDGATLRSLVGILLILPELERSADLAEHIAQRAVSNVGPEMTPVSRGIVQRMSEVAVEMWRTVADAYAERSAQAGWLAEADEELDILHRRLTGEVATEAMPAAIGAQVTLLARFYERLGDHAVNLARRIETLAARGG